MAGSIVFLEDLAVVTIVAALTSLVFQRLRLPLVFGLLAAGVIIGPHTPPFSLVQDEGNLQTLADFGVVLILFGLGLDFNLRTIRRVGVAAVAVMTVEVLLMLWLGYEAGILFGWSRLDAIFLGAMLSVSSTAIIVSVLRELGRLDLESSRVVFAVLVLEDLAAILILVLLGGYAATGALPLKEAALVGARMCLFLFGGLVVGLLVIPRFLDAVVTRYRSEVTVLAVLGLALGAGILSHLAGFHVGLGAFLAGALASEAKKKHLVEERFRPIHDLFGAVFFVSIGTLVNFVDLAAYWQPVLLITVVIVVGKLVSGGLATFLAGYSPRTSIEVGSSLAQIGEFSFVIAAVGLASGKMSGFLFPVIVGAAALTSFASPLMIRFAPQLGKTLGRAMPAPARTFAAVYTNWMEGLRAPSGGPTTEARLARRRAVGAGVIAAAVLGAALVMQGSGTAWCSALLGSQAAGALVYWGAVLVVAGPLLFETARELARWTDAVQAARGPSKAPALGVRAMVRSTLYVAAVLVLGLPVMVATAPFIRGPVVFLVWATIVALALVALGGGVRRLHRRLHENVEALLNEESAGAVPVPEVLQAVVAKGLTGPLETQTMTIDSNAWVVGRPIAETGLRTHTGASILVVNRGTGQVPAGPSLTLLPGDDVVLLGSREQTDAAKTLLARRAEAGLTKPMQPGQLAVPDGSPLAGKTLAESEIRVRFGIQVVAIQRAGKVIANPNPGERLLPGDVLVALGTDQSLLHAQQALHAIVPPT